MKAAFIFTIHPHWVQRISPLASLALLAFVWCGQATAQERPYLVTYDHQLEEPDSLEIGLNPVLGSQRGAHDFGAASVEVEYGVKGWWTTEVYLAGQRTHGDGTAFTGVRWENRWRPLWTEHRVNPLLYVELERINEADKTLLEVVGHDVEADHAVANSEARQEYKNEVETKLILSSSVAGWNVSGNLIAEKNLANAPWEFGYAVGVSRTLAMAASATPCRFCKENFAAGVEMYGGLGEAHSLGLTDTSHYLAPVLGWNLPSGVTLRVSPAFGLNANSHRFLLRLGASYEVPGAGRQLARLFGRS